MSGMDAHDGSGWALVWEFPDQSPSFANGVICGRLWERMKLLVHPFELQVPADVRECVQSVADAAGWQVAFTPVEQEGNAWLMAWFEPPA